MRTVISFLIFVSLVIIASPLLAYPVYLILESFFDLRFHKLVSHTTLICGLIFSGVYLRYHQLYFREAFGFGVAKNIFLKDLLQGLIAGVLLLTVIKAILILTGVHQIRPNLDYFWSNLPLIFFKAVLTGLVVGLIEESMFRGALFSSLYKKTNAFIAISLTSFVYAAVHFLKYRELPEGSEITWLTGIQMLPDAFFKLSHHIADHFLTLFTLGVLLSMIRLRNGNIALCIGVHAGIVMALKISSRFSQHVPNSQFGYLVNSFDRTQGYLSFALLLISAIIYWRRFLFVK